MASVWFLMAHSLPKGLLNGLLNPILPVTKRDNAAELGERAATLLSEVIKVGLRGLECTLAGAAPINNTVAP